MPSQICGGPCKARVTTLALSPQSTNWAIETIVFSGDKVEALYKAANDVFINNGTQSDQIHNWSYWQNDATLDAEKVSTILND
jgi:hypothetical protein